jgi:hypothetical protein
LISDENIDLVYSERKTLFCSAVVQSTWFIYGMSLVGLWFETRLQLILCI